MKDRTVRKMKAAGKIALGVGKGIGALMMGTGHGLVGAAMKRHHMMGQAVRIASKNLQSAGKTIDEGVRDWDQA